ncbi:MAG TPA: sigma-70 family RNA polymerase sigma factor [Candidatus Mediterraneibacter norfolkensis]|nr:sigma-70 family RNA polymerase sigma factor [Candidatus Mediterraneibacter norfolkensis]
MKTFPKPLSAGEEREYLKRCSEGDQEARDVLVLRNMRLVAHVVKKYQGTDYDMEDLISLGTIGLIKAINTFKTDKGSRLATYAAKCVENAILSPMRFYSREKSPSKDCSHIGRYLQSFQMKIISCAEQIGISRGHYIDYEVGYVDYYPKEVVDRLADFYHIPVEDLLDEYNLFLYKGQGKMLKECREKMGLKKKPFARMLHVDPNTYRNWESDKKRMFKLTWEKYFREVLLANQNASNQNNI